MPPVPDLPRLIPLTARVVLDVGCGRGEIGAAYRRLNPNARLLAIDNDPAMVAAASPHYHACRLADAETDSLPFDIPKGGIDCIAYIAVLEQLSDPFAMLRRHAEVLAPDGMMLLCVSNVQHWTLTQRLLRGTFRYEDSGLLDQRHRHWFSLESMRTGLTEAGLLPVDVMPRVFDEAGGMGFIQAMAPALRNLGIDPNEYMRTALPLQYVWRVRKAPVAHVPWRRMAVAGDMLKPVGGVSHLRVIHPLMAMGSDPAVQTHLTAATDPPDVSGFAEDEPRIFILHRPALFGAEGQRTINTLIDKGWLVITEFDDHPDFLRGLAHPSLVSFRGVHALQTTTRTLAAVLRPRNPELALFPNAIETLPDTRNFTDPGVLTVFFGALNREADWRPLMDAINAVLAQVGDRLRFRVVHDEGFFQALATVHKTFTPLCDYDTYLDLLGTSEISLMPLEDTEFNRAKSDLKFIEAGACRVAALASSVVYTDSIAHGETGLIFHDAEEFHRLFLRLAMEPDLALDLGNNARGMVIRERMLAGQVATRLAWYRSLWERRAALTETLRYRIEGLPLPAG